VAAFTALTALTRSRRWRRSRPFAFQGEGLSVSSQVRGAGRFAASISRLCFAVMVVGILGLFTAKALISHAPAAIAAQIAAVALMLWARVTFGRRSFHATAEPTAGGLVTSGPYAFFRHPIYTAVCLFTLAGALTYRTPAAFAWFALVVAGAIGRMLCEETLLRERFPEYAAYARRTARMVPFLF
jgi:protein-S-isoprenylcysteine O-methyltransferase Ste14